MIIIVNNKTAEIIITDEPLIVRKRIKARINELNEDIYKDVIKDIREVKDPARVFSEKSIIITFDPKFKDEKIRELLQIIAEQVGDRYIPQLILRSKYILLLKKYLKVIDREDAIELRLEMEKFEKEESVVVPAKDFLTIDLCDLSCGIDKLIHWLSNQKIRGIINDDDDEPTQCYSDKITELETLKRELYNMNSDLKMISARYIFGLVE